MGTVLSRAFERHVGFCALGQPAWAFVLRTRSFRREAAVLPPHRRRRAVVCFRDWSTSSGHRRKGSDQCTARMGLLGVWSSRPRARNTLYWYRASDAGDLSAALSWRVASGNALLRSGYAVFHEIIQSPRSGHAFAEVSA